jgi:hypothetical protein
MRTDPAHPAPPLSTLLVVRGQVVEPAKEDSLYLLKDRTIGFHVLKIVKEVDRE